MTNGSNNTATITPQHSSASKSAPKTSEGTHTGKGSDSRIKKRLKLDSRLEPIRETIESQPIAIQDTLGDTAVAMLLATRKLRERRAGLVNMTRNVTAYPRSCNLKAKLAFPQEMKDDPQTQENATAWDSLILKTKDEMKRQVLKQNERIVEFLQEKRLALFHEKVLTIAEGYFTWFSELHGLETPPTLSHRAYGAASLYCFFNCIGPGDSIFGYLGSEQEALLSAFKKEFLTTTAGNALFTEKQLQDITMLLPDDYEPGTSRRLDSGSPNREIRDADPDQTMTANSQGAPTVTTTPVPTPLPSDLEHVIYLVRTRIDLLVPKLFVELTTYVETSQRELTANAKLEATLSNKKALDIAKILDDDMASQPIVAPENMATLVNSLVDKRIETKGKLAQKKLTQEAVKDARKKSLGGAPVAKTPPGKHGNGGKRKSSLKAVSFGSTPPQTKRAKKFNTQHPQADYEQIRSQRHSPNPYRASSPSGRGFNPGRGRGRGRGRGASNRGRGRGRGRF
jgi:hypothetical protein